MPREGISREEYRTRKFGSWERSKELDANVSTVGESEGIHFAFDNMERTPNTVDAHRIIWLANEHGCQDAIVEALFRAYFTEGQDIGNRQTLINVVTEADLDQQAAEAMLESDEGMDVIAIASELSKRHRVDSVPFFIINDTITLSGAQDSEMFISAFKQVQP